MRIHVGVAVASLVLAFAPASAEAQLVLKPAIGLTYTDVTQDPATGKAQGKAGWQIGATILMGERLYFETGLFYAQRSTEITAVTTSGNVSVDGVKGFRIPAMIGYRLIGPASGGVGLRIFGGASAFALTSVTADGVSKSDFNSLAWGAFAGAGVDFLMLFVDASYEWGLTKFSKLSEVDVGQSRGLFLNAGIRF